MAHDNPLAGMMGWEERHVGYSGDTAQNMFEHSIESIGGCRVYLHGFGDSVSLLILPLIFVVPLFLFWRPCRLQLHRIYLGTSHAVHKFWIKSDLQLQSFGGLDTCSASHNT